MRVRSVVLLLLLVAFARPARAQHEHHAAAPAAEEHEHEYRNILSLFTGVTIEEDESAFTLGFDYERRLGSRVGVGVILDDAFGQLREFIVAPALYLHPTRALRLDLAPGAERKRLEDGEVEWEFLFRVGADYDVELTPRWSVAPNVNADFVGGRTVWVLGVELGYRF